MGSGWWQGGGGDVKACFSCPCEISLGEHMLFTVEFSYEICFRYFLLSCRCEISL
jgi:hypothetical protein